MIAEGRPGFNPGNETFVCSNHFVNGEPTPGHPYPTLALKSPSSVERKPPKQRQPINVWPTQKNYSEPISNSPTSHSPVLISPSIHSALRFSFITREADVRFYTGLPGTSHFHTLYKYIEKKALMLNYWRGLKRLSSENNGNVGLPKERTGPKRKLSTEQEFLMVLMKLR